MNDRFAMTSGGRGSRSGARSGRALRPDDLEGLEAREVLSQFSFPATATMFPTAPAPQATAPSPPRFTFGSEPVAFSFATPAALFPAAAPGATAPSAPALSPPWFTFRNELVATVGKTPGVAVSPLVEVTGNKLAVDVVTDDFLRGVALASVLAPAQEFGNLTVQVNVATTTGVTYTGVTPTSAEQAGLLETLALHGNPAFEKVAVQPATPSGGPDEVFPVFTRTVVQFFDDNLADLYQNTNIVTAQAFRDVLAPEIGGIVVNPSTAV